MRISWTLTAIASVALLSGCGGPRYQSTTITYQMVPAKRPAQAKTFQVQSAEPNIPGITIPGMEAAATNPDLVIEVSAEPVHAQWTTNTNAFIYEADGLGNDGKPIMLCREWRNVGLPGPAKAIPIAAFVAQWKTGAFKREYRVSIKDKSGAVLDQGTVEAGALLSFGKPGATKGSNVATEGTSVQGEIRIGGGSDYTTTSGGVMSSLSGEPSAKIVAERAQEAEQAVRYRHEKVWASGEAISSAGQPVVAEATVYGWREQMLGQPVPALEADFAQHRTKAEAQGLSLVQADAVTKVSADLAVKLGSGGGQRQVFLALLDSDPRFNLVPTALGANDRTLLPELRKQLTLVLDDPAAKPLTKAIATYDLALVAIAQGNLAEAQKLAGEAADGAIALGGGLMGPGDDDFTVKAMDLSIALGESSQKSPKKPKPAEEPSTLKKVNNFLSGLGF